MIILRVLVGHRLLLLRLALLKLWFKLLPALPILPVAIWFIIIS